MIDPKTSEALDLVQEECAEVIQIISKIRRFGFDSYNPYDTERKTNQHLLNDELGDLCLLIRYLTDREIVDPDHIEDRIAWKIEKLKKYTTLFSD
jgi:hypothetical protein